MKNRIAEIIETQKLTSQKFASLIGVVPAAVSHILNGRNKPSMDVIEKILNTFRTINPDWLILGVGAMYRETGETSKKQQVEVKITPNKPQMPSLFQDETENGMGNATENEFMTSTATSFTQPKIVDSTIPFEQPPATIENKKTENKQTEQYPQLLSSKKVIKKIIVYYSDNTFEEYNMRLNTEQ